MLVQSNSDIQLGIHGTSIASKGEQGPSLHPKQRNQICNTKFFNYRQGIDQSTFKVGMNFPEIIILRKGQASRRLSIVMPPFLGKG